LAAACGSTQDAPDILLIMTDDVGFGAPSTFGGVIPTPALDRIANNGLRYTNFHSTLCVRPTRAALITGVITTRSVMA
jgi:arylsulfatase